MNGQEAKLAEAYTITFDANGGKGKMKPQKVVKGKEVNLTANAYTRRGNTFKNWNEKADGSGSGMNDKAKVKPVNDVTLFAQWTTHDLTVSSIDDQTYTGKAIEPAVTVKDGDETLVLDTDYTVEYKDNTDAGTATVTVKGKGDYKDATAVNKTFKIAKADASVATAPKGKSLTYTGSAQALVEEGVAEGGEMQYSLDGTTFNKTVPTATDAGDYTVTYKVVGDKNHNDTTAQTVKATIAKADPTVTVLEVYHKGAVDKLTII